MNKRGAHNLVWVPIFSFGLIILIIGVLWYLYPEPWLIDKIPNEILLQASFDNLFSKEINSHLPSYLYIVYKFCSLSMIFIGLLINVYVYVTRLGTKLSRNSIQIVLFIFLIGFYNLVISYIPTSILLSILYPLSILLICSIYFSIQLEK